ncbi:MAG: DUF58 domain-containing protein [Verrucomicrobia bacterium]|nr:DUF58 domain-containing protein [Verrucomicrobiota bacterium]
MAAPIPVSSQPSVRGAVLGGVGVSLLVAGMWRVDGALAALGLGTLALQALAWLLGRLNLANLSATLDAPSSVPAGVMFPALLTIHNRRGFWDSFDLRVELELPGKARATGHVRWVSARTAADIDLRIAVPTRAHASAHVVRVGSSFPMGLFEMRRTLVADHELLVFPRPIQPRGLRAMGVLMDAAPQDGASAGEAAGEPRGLRPWRPGDSMRRIDWPSSVRAWSHGSGLVVRETDPPGFHPRRCMVLFHSFGFDGSLIRPERFEHALSLASGTIRHLHGLGIPVRLIADFDGWNEHPAATRAQLTACQELLARAHRAKGTEAHDLHAAAAKVWDDEVLVAISDMPPSVWRGALPRLRLPPVTPDLPADRPKRKPHPKR